MRVVTAYRSGLSCNNSSLTDAVQISEWQLKLANDAEVPMRPLVTVKLGAKIIPPNQTILIVASRRSQFGRVPGFTSS